MLSFIAGLVTFIVVMCIAIHFIRTAYEWMVIRLFKGLIRRKRKIYVVL